MSFLARTLGTLGSQGLLVILGFLNNTLVANRFGAEGQGTFALLMLVPMLLIMLSNLGLGIADVYFAGSRRYSVTVLAAQSILFAGVVGSMAIAAFFVTAAIISTRSSALLKIVVWVVPFSLITLFLGNLFQGLNRIREYNLTTLIPKFLLFLLLVISLFLLKLPIEGVAVAYLVAEITTAILLLILFNRWVLTDKTGFRLNIHVLKEMLHFGVRGFFGNILNFLNYRLDMFIILFFLDRKALGFYSIAVLLSEKIWLIPNSIAIVLFPHVAANSQKEDLTPFICRTSIWLTFLLSLALFFLAEFIIRLFYIEEYLASVRPLQLILPGIISLGVMKVLSADLAGRGKPLLITLTSVVALICNFGANWLLIPVWGIAGAALASTLSYTISAGVSVFFYRRVTGKNLSHLFVPTTRDLNFYRNFLKKLFVN